MTFQKDGKQVRAPQLVEIQTLAGEVSAVTYDTLQAGDWVMLESNANGDPEVVWSGSADPR